VDEYKYFGLELKTGQRLVTRSRSLGDLVNDTLSVRNDEFAYIDLFDFETGDYLPSAVIREMVYLVVTLNDVPKKLDKEKQRGTIDDPEEFLRQFSRKN